jgi:anti-sigma factor (TIGR02949 family)
MGEENRMRCEDVVANLLDYLDHEAGSQLKRGIARHLEECRSCCSRADFELALRKRIGEAVQQELPEKLRARIGKIVDQF